VLTAVSNSRLTSSSLHSTPPRPVTSVARTLAPAPLLAATPPRTDPAPPLPVARTLVLPAAPLPALAPPLPAAWTTQSTLARKATSPNGPASLPPAPAEEEDKHSTPSRRQRAGRSQLTRQPRGVRRIAGSTSGTLVSESSGTI
jgi:hypothetical protein